MFIKYTRFQWIRLSFSLNLLFLVNPLNSYTEWTRLLIKFTSFHWIHLFVLLNSLVFIEFAPFQWTHSSFSLISLVSNESTFFYLSFVNPFCDSSFCFVISCSLWLAVTFCDLSFLLCFASFVICRSIVFCRNILWFVVLLCVLQLHFVICRFCFVIWCFVLWFDVLFCDLPPNSVQFACFYRIRSSSLNTLRISTEFTHPGKDGRKATREVKWDVGKQRIIREEKNRLKR